MLCDDDDDDDDVVVVVVCTQVDDQRGGSGRLRWSHQPSQLASAPRHSTTSHQQRSPWTSWLQHGASKTFWVCVEGY